MQTSGEPPPASGDNSGPADPLHLCRSALEVLDQGDYPLEIAARLGEVIAMLEACQK